MATKHLGTNLKENIARLRKTFMEGVNAVQPQELIKQYVSRESDTIIINKQRHKLNQNVYIVGFGKAVIGMVPPLEILLKTSNSLSHLRGGMLSVPCGIQNTFANRPNLLPSEDSVIEIMEGAKDNIPDDDAFKAAKKITTLVQKLKKEDLLIVLISGGGSALLPYPLPPTTMVEKKDIVKALSRAGATITELNTVRKALSAVKGGKLAEMTKTHIISLILSDVINSPLDMIASGPTVVDHDPVGAALNVLEKYSIPIPDHTRDCLQNRSSSISDQKFPHVSNILIGSNETALAAVNMSIAQLTNNKDCSLVLSSSLQGEALDIGEKISQLAANVTDVICGNGDIGLITESLLIDLCVSSDKRKSVVEALENVHKHKTPIWFTFGGETTVTVHGAGCGGRNQEMVLSTSISLEKKMEGSEFSGEILFLSGGTDGIDGPTDAAGALTYWISTPLGITSQLQEAKQQGLNPESYLKDNDSYNYFSCLSNAQYLLKPGHTGTNVMDLQILFICPRS